MAETFVENRVCAACGKDVRKGALFCYYCGGAIAPEVAATAANGDSVSSGWFRENIAEEEVKIKKAEKSKVTAKLDKKVSEKVDKPIEKPIDTPLEKPPEKPQTKEEPKLKSAAAMRRRAKSVQKKRVEEVVWEEHENAPNVWFMSVAFILILIAAGLFFLAVYMK